MDDDTTTLVIVGDLHAGSEYGLCPPRATLDGGGSYRLNKWQRWLDRNWRDFWGRVAALEGRKVYVFDGDLIQGQPFGDVQLWTVNTKDQERAAIECIATALEIAPADEMFFVRGTESHTGKAGQSDERIAAQFVEDEKGKMLTQPRYSLDAELRETPVSHFRLDLEIDGVRVMVKHHPSSRSMRVYTAGGAVNRAVAQLLTIAGKYGYPAPHLAIWAHTHRVEDSGETWPHCRGIYGPCWQLETAYGHRITDEPPSVGGTIVRIADEAYNAEVVRYLLPRRKAIRL